MPSKEVEGRLGHLITGERGGGDLTCLLSAAVDVVCMLSTCERNVLLYLNFISSFAQSVLLSRILILHAQSIISLSVRHLQIKEGITSSENILRQSLKTRCLYTTGH